MDKYAQPFKVKPVPITTAKYFKVLTGSYYFAAVQVIVCGVIAVGLLIFFNAIEKGGFWGESTDQFMIVLFCSISVLYCIVSVWISRVLIKKRLSKIDSSDSLLTKTKTYRKAHAQSLTILSGAAIFSMAIFLVTGKILLIVLVIIMVVLLFYSKPTKEHLINDLQLSSDEISVMNDPEGIIG